MIDSQQVVCEGFPENKRALRFGAFAFTLTIGGGSVLAGGPGVSIGENDQSGCDHHGGQEQTYGQIAIHGTFFV